VDFAEVEIALKHLMRGHGLDAPAILSFGFKRQFGAVKDRMHWNGKFGGAGATQVGNRETHIIFKNQIRAVKFQVVTQLAE